MRIKSLLACTILTASVTWAQTAKVPKLKDQVALDLRTAQFRLANVRVQEGQAYIQILQLQQQEAKLGQDLQDKLKSALKDSDLDPSKYQLDPDTLTVKELPHGDPKAN